MSDPCSLLTCGEATDRQVALEEYTGGLPRWCPGCGDHAILSGVQRMLESEQVVPERTVFVSGIGCSSRFPHYVKTYGFHGIHGRALPLATGIKLSRPELDVFAVMGDGDCCSIGAGHWIHALRYNVDMVALLLDNNIYGLTKNQSSPTTPQGHPSNTAPDGAWLPALNPLTVTLGVTNASFVAQTADWAPSHLYETLRAAHRHRGFSFVRILQRCPVFTPGIFMEAVRKPERIELLVHDDGVRDEAAEELYEHHVAHDPSDLNEARRLAETSEHIRLGVFHRDPSRPTYETTRRLPVFTAEERIAVLTRELDRHAV